MANVDWAEVHKVARDAHISAAHVMKVIEKYCPHEVIDNSSGRSEHYYCVACSKLIGDAEWMAFAEDGAQLFDLDGNKAGNYSWATARIIPDNDPRILRNQNANDDSA